jgi:hypothetical protein
LTRRVFLKREQGACLSTPPKNEPPIGIVKSYLGLYAQELNAQVTSDSAAF